jgi:hypothetical protein
MCECDFCGEIRVCNPVDEDESIFVCFECVFTSMNLTQVNEDDLED